MITETMMNFISAFEAEMNEDGIEKAIEIECQQDQEMLGYLSYDFED